MAKKGNERGTSLLDKLTHLIRKVTRDINGDAIDSFGKSYTGKAVEVIKEAKSEANTADDALIDNYIVFTSAGGGAGASTIVANVASELSNRGLDVIVIDLNIMYPMHQVYLGVDEGLKHNLVDVLLGNAPLGDCIYSKKKYHIMYSGNSTMIELAKCNSDGAVSNFEEMINKLKSLYDVVIVDAPMRVEDKIINNAFYGCDNVYVVWDEGVNCIVNTERLKNNMSIVGISSSKIKVILNKRTNIRYTSAPFNKTGVELIQVLPFTSEVIKSGLSGKVFIDSAASREKAAIGFEKGIHELSNKILMTGGMISNGNEGHSESAVAEGQ